MRILDPDQDRALDEVAIYLTPEEAREMRDSLNHLLEHFQEPEEHVHVADSDFKHEITISIYTESNLKYFNQRSRKLIAEDR